MPSTTRPVLVRRALARRDARNVVVVAEVSRAVRTMVIAAVAA